MSVIVYQFQTVKFIQMMSLTFGLFTQVSGSGPLGPLVRIFTVPQNGYAVSKGVKGGGGLLVLTLNTSNSYSLFKSNQIKYFIVLYFVKITSLIFFKR